MIVTYCASQMLQFVSHCGHGGNLRVPVHVRMGLRQPVHLSADEGCVCVGGGGSGCRRESCISHVTSIVILSGGCRGNDRVHMEVGGPMPTYTSSC